MTTPSEAVGHAETVTDLPHPTARTHIWNLALLGLPAAVLSWASVVVTLLVPTTVLWLAPVRALFRLPLPAGAFALAAAIAAGVVTWRCAPRPGRGFPRFWALGLTGALAALALFTLADPTPGGAPWSHAAALAGLAGSLVLCPRLISVRPQQLWLEAVAPAAVAGALLILAPVLTLARWSYLREIARFDDTVAGLRSWTDELGAGVVAGAGGGAAANPSALERRLETLGRIALAGRGSPELLWRTAAVLEREDELGETLAGLVAGAVDGLDPARAPRVSALDEPAVRWDPEAREWHESAEFARWSGLVGAYYRSLGGLFSCLDPRRLHGASPALRRYRDRYRGERDLLGEHLAATRERWTDHWAVARVAVAPDLIDPVLPTLARLLATPLAPEDPEGVAAADLGRLLDLDRERARELAARAPGCRLRRYAEGGRDYERVDCHAYAPALAEGSLGAELRLELRVVFVGAGRAGGQPAEVFLLFPVPADRPAAEYAEAVAGDLADAAAARWEGSFRLRDRSGSTRLGFLLAAAGRRIVVYRPQVVPFLDGRRAVVIRAERAGA